MDILSQKKLVEVLLDERKIDPDIAATWQNLSNLEVETKLKNGNMISEEDIARAYGELYGIDFVNLKDMKIPQETLEMLPQKLAQAYKLIAYERQKGKPEIIRIAVAEPGRLTTNLQNFLKNIETQKGFKIELATTTVAAFNQVIKQYPKESPSEEVSPQAISTTSTPPPTPTMPVTPAAPIAAPKSQFKKIDLDQITIPYEVITKFPEDIARKYQMVVFEAPHPSLIKVAMVNPEDPKIQDILNFIKEKNDIMIEGYVAGPKTIEKAMRFYETPQMQIAEPPPTAKPAPTPPKEIKPAPIPMAKPIPQVIQPIPEKPQEKAPAEKLPEINHDEDNIIKSASQNLNQTPQERLPDINHDDDDIIQPQIKQEEEIPEIKGKPQITPLILPTESDLDKFLGQDVKDISDLEEIAQTGNVPKIVAAVIIYGVFKKVSDIHIEPTEKNLRVRFRVDGILRDIIKLPIETHPAIVSRVKILSKLKIDESRIPQDGRFDVVAQGHAIDLRVSTLPTIHGEKIALRILDKSAHIYTLEELGITGRGLKVLLENMNKPYGVILATGPTGSGKTTTLYAILNRISNASVNIITLEDPVEYEMGGINQCQIRPKIGFTFANGLRSVLRQDPNIIMVGEIRDSETASLATHAALTGHLVLSTLHTNDAAGALPRIIDMGVEPFFLTSLINAIIAQRLVRKLCPKCKRPAHIPEPILKQIETELAKFNFPKPFKFFEGAGCDECDLGYKGRIGIYEVLVMSAKIEDLVLNRKPSSEIKNQSIQEGMVTMKQDGLIKALKGQTTVNEVLRVITV